MNSNQLVIVLDILREWRNTFKDFREYWSQMSHGRSDDEWKEKAEARQEAFSALTGAVQRLLDEYVEILRISKE